MLTYYISPRRGMLRQYANASERQNTEVHIPVDVVAEGDDYMITALVPGVSVDSVQIEILENVVSISGEFAQVEDEEVKYLLRERPSGKFSRSLRLPTLLNASGAKAEVTNGVLSLRVPKAEEAKAKQIKVIAK